MDRRVRPGEVDHLVGHGARHFEASRRPGRTLARLFASWRCVLDLGLGYDETRGVGPGVRDAALAANVRSQDCHEPPQAFSPTERSWPPGATRRDHPLGFPVAGPTRASLWARGRDRLAHVSAGRPDAGLGRRGSRPATLGHDLAMEILMLAGHSGPVRQIRFSADGSIMATRARRGGQRPRSLPLALLARGRTDASPGPSRCGSPMKTRAIVLGPRIVEKSPCNRLRPSTKVRQVRASGVNPMVAVRTSIRSIAMPPRRSGCLTRRRFSMASPRAAHPRVADPRQPVSPGFPRIGRLEYVAHRCSVASAALPLHCHLRDGDAPGSHQQPDAKAAGVFDDDKTRRRKPARPSRAGPEGRGLRPRLDQLQPGKRRLPDERTGGADVPALRGALRPGARERLPAAAGPEVLPRGADPRADAGDAQALEGRAAHQGRDRDERADRQAGAPPQPAARRRPGLPAQAGAAPPDARDAGPARPDRQGTASRAGLVPLRPGATQTPAAVHQPSARAGGAGPRPAVRDRRHQGRIEGRRRRRRRPARRSGPAR